MKKRDEHIDIIIRNSWGSLVSHLDAIKGQYDGATTPKGRKHHIVAMREYALIIAAALELY